MFREAIRIDAAFAPPYLGLAKVLLQQGNTKQGRGVLQEAMRLKPDDPQPLCLLGDSLLSSGETSQAVPLYRKAVEKDADCIPALLRLAQIFSASSAADPQTRKEAVQLATRACTLTNYGSAEALLTLSDAHAAAGNFVEAVSTAYRALQIADQSGNAETANMARLRLKRYEKR